MTEYEIGLGHGGMEMWDKFQPSITRLQNLLKRVMDSGCVSYEGNEMLAELEADICAVIAYAPKPGVVAMAEPAWVRDMDHRPEERGSPETEPYCKTCNDHKTLPNNDGSGFWHDCPDCCGEEG